MVASRGSGNSHSVDSTLRYESPLDFNIASGGGRDRIWLASAPASRKHTVHPGHKLRPNPSITSATYLNQNTQCLAKQRAKAKELTSK